MSFKIAALDRLIHELSRLPGLGEKTAQRLAFHLLKVPSERVDHLVSALQDVKATVHFCPQCFSFTDLELCVICSDHQRDSEVFCVVEDPADILRIESSMPFKGKYHVLQGALSPLDGIGPDQLRIKELVARIKQDGVREIILALDADMEGDATSIYVTNLVKPLGVKVTRIAHGIPIGGNLDYIDYRTLSRAIENRVEL